MPICENCSTVGFTYIFGGYQYLCYTCTRLLNNNNYKTTGQNWR